MSNILVVGSLAYDTISTPHGRVDRALGGSANYFSLAASLFSKVRVVGVVGEDYDAGDLEMLRVHEPDRASQSGGEQIAGDCKPHGSWSRAGTDQCHGVRSEQMREIANGQ